MMTKDEAERVFAGFVRQHEKDTGLALLAFARVVAGNTREEWQKDNRELTRWRAMLSTPEICARELTRLRGEPCV